MSNLRGDHKRSVLDAVSQRHSIHAFDKTRPVSKELLSEVFENAQNSASNRNIQPWEVKVLAGDMLAAAQAKLVECFRTGVHFAIPPTPPQFLAKAEASGSLLYGPEGYGIARDDAKARNEKVAGNFRNYGAPCLALFCIDKDLASADVVSVGIYLQTVILLLWERGVGTIPQVSMAAYMQVWKELLDFPNSHQILCGLAIGYPDEEAKVTRMRMPKDNWKEHVVFYS